MKMLSEKPGLLIVDVKDWQVKTDEEGRTFLEIESIEIDGFVLKADGRLYKKGGDIADLLKKSHAAADLFHNGGDEK